MQGEMRHGRPLLAALVAASGTLGAATTAEADTGMLLPDLVPAPPSDVHATADGERVQLRFRSSVANAGTGPLLLDSRRPSTERDVMAADQLVRHADGRYTVRRDVGSLRFVRSRWQLARFGRYELYRGGVRVRTARGAGTCRGLQCGLPGLLALRFGLPAGSARGSIDVTGLPAGEYRLVHRVNAGVALLESDYADNSACVGVRLGPAVREVPC
jgi:hypothetical protein